MKLWPVLLLALVGSSQAIAATQTLSLTCPVAYMPARSTWVRQVQIEWDEATIRAVRIDGLTPYSFALHPDGLVTAIDNERIEIDVRQATWASDFRGLATGRGRCERDEP